MQAQDDKPWVGTKQRLNTKSQYTSAHWARTSREVDGSSGVDPNRRDRGMCFLSPSISCNVATPEASYFVVVLDE